MKVLDLQCSQGHSFEGWFGSQDDYGAQRARGLVTCPVCNDNEVVKMLSAPRLNLGHGVAPEPSGNAASSSAFTSGLTPATASTTTSSQLSAPPLASGTGAAPHALSASNGSHALQQMQAAMLNMLRQVVANTEDVGPQFAEEARKIHYGESEERNIRGQATREEAEALLEEGIEVVALPLPENLKGPLQ
jgi:hypothetical protein